MVSGVKFVFSVYDFDSKNEMDGSFIGPALRALGLTPSLAYIAQLGGTTVKGNSNINFVENFLETYIYVEISHQVKKYFLSKNSYHCTHLQRRTKMLELMKITSNVSGPMLKEEMEKYLRTI